MGVCQILLLCTFIVILAALAILGSLQESSSRASSSPRLVEDHNIDLWSFHAVPFDIAAPSSLSSKYGMTPASWMRAARRRPRLTLKLVSGVSSPLPMVVVLPGGGWTWLNTEKEGRPVCRWLNAARMHCAIVEYRTLRTHPAPFLDARRAIQLVRQNAAVWGVDPQRVVIMGFSAGGHTAGLAALSWDAAEARQSDRALQAAGDSASSQRARPDAAVLAYPGVRPPGVGARYWEILLGEPPRADIAMDIARGGGEKVTALRSALRRAAISLDWLAARSELPPPLFMWHTMADTVVPANSTRLLAAALEARGSSVEAHLFEGPLKHGVALAYGKRTRGRAVARWTRLCRDWMRHSLGPANGRMSRGRARAAPLLARPGHAVTVWPW